MKVIVGVIDQGRSLDQSLEKHATSASDHPRDFALLQEIAYGVVRWYLPLKRLAESRLNAPFKLKDLDVLVLLIVGIYQLHFLRIPDHAAISETVAACQLLGKPWAKGVINAILRGLQRAPDRLDDWLTHVDPMSTHPKWLAAQIEQQWPKQCSSIFQANDQPPPMIVRLNLKKLSRDHYLRLLENNVIRAQASRIAESAVVLTSPVPVAALPKFSEGWVSVQDHSAQLAAPALHLSEGLRVLDACAAPGGKTGHILELEPNLKELVAVDISSNRMQRVNENLRRLGLKATTLIADLKNIDSWWDGQRFDRILLDVPCSGTGVIRRHPDIKHNRRQQDIMALAKEQRNLLDALWSLLKPGGKLLYVTCSILAEENQIQIKQFLQRQNDAIDLRLSENIGEQIEVGYQRLPGIHDGDGFYYACLGHKW